MKIYYLAKIRHNKEMEDGMLKQVTEEVLLDAVSYTDAETIAYAYAEQCISGEFMITQITKTNLSEVIINEDADIWFKCKVVYATVDGDKDKEVTINTYLLVSATDARQAYDRIEEHLNSMLVPFSIPSVNQTKILEVIDGMEYNKLEKVQ